MAGSIADVSIKVVANANGVGPPLSAAEKQLLAFDKKAREIGSASGGLASIGSRFGLLAGALSAGAVFSGAVNTINKLDDLGDMAEGLGDTATNMSRLHFAAEMMGSSAGAVDSAIAKMVKSIGSAAREGGAAKEAIDRMGLSVDDLRKMQPSAAFIAITNALSKLPTTYDKAHLASKIFGKGAMEIIAILKAGEGEIEAYGRRLDEIGGTITEDQVEKAARLKDQITEMSYGWESLKSALIGVGSPAVSGALTATSRALGVLGDALMAIKITLASITGKDVVEVATGSKAAQERKRKAEEMGKAAEEMAKAQDDLDKQMADDEKYQKDMEAKATALESSVRTAKEIRNDQVDELNELYLGEFISLDVAQRRMEQIEKQYQEVVDREQKILGEAMADIIAALNKPQKDMETSLASFFEEMTERAQDYGKSLTESVMTPMERYEEKIRDITAALNLGTISQETYNRATKKAFEDAKREMGDGGDSINGDVYQQIDPVLQDMIDFSMPRAGFAGDGSMPANWRLFTPPEMGPRQSVMASDFMDEYGNITTPRSPFETATVPLISDQLTNDPVVIEQTNYLRQIAQNTAAMGVPA